MKIRVFCRKFVLLALVCFACTLVRLFAWKNAGHSALVFGLCSSQVTITDRISGVTQWWDSRLNGVLLLETQVSRPLPALPDGLTIIKTSASWDFLTDGERCAWGQVMNTYNSFPQADWYVLGDDDTLFVPQALEVVLSGYDASKPWYMGSLSENPDHNAIFGGFLLRNGSQLGKFAFGGGGIIISQSLMQIIVRGYEQCLHDHAGMFGGDQRIGACVKVLSPETELTILSGLHQIDVAGSHARELLEAHALEPLLSLHHMQSVALPVPGNLQGLRLQIKGNPFGALQQSVCQVESFGTFSIAAGLSVRWWNAGVVVNTTEVMDPKQRDMLPKISRYFVSTKAFHLPRSTQQRTTDSCYTALDVLQSSSEVLTPAFDKIMVQEPSGHERWLQSSTKRLHCSTVTLDEVHSSVQIVLTEPQTTD